jgi:DNA-binding NtrC family response regulator
VDVRLVAATNRDLAQEVQAGRFREDLFHRLHVVAVHLPSLSERAGDIAILATHFLNHFAPPEAGVSLSPEALAKLNGHRWPGNVRELRNVIQRAVLLRRGSRISADEITFPASTLSSRVQTASATSSRTLFEIERDAIVAELRRHGGSKSEAADALGVSRSTIHRKMEEYGIDIEAVLRD